MICDDLEFPADQIHTQFCDRIHNCQKLLFCRRVIRLRNIQASTDHSNHSLITITVILEQNPTNSDIRGVSL